jgi:tryptophan synthase alpha chain
MSKIDQAFKKLKIEERAALIPFIVGGDPDIETTEVLIRKMAESGADIIEIGVPFSDPLVDGPTIQAASYRALQKEVGLKEILNITKKFGEFKTPLVVMTYFNPVFRYGLKVFAMDCRECGIDGVIIPDLPPEEAGPWIDEAREVNLDTIFLASPTSPLERIKKVSQYSRGFIYYVSVTGVTGVRERLPEDLEMAVRQIKEQTQKPIAVGFGISSPEQIKEVSRFADGVIIGSAIVKLVEENLNHSDLTNKISDFVLSLAKALKSPPHHPLSSQRLCDNGMSEGRGSRIPKF